MGLGMFLTELASSSGKVSFLSRKDYPSRILKRSVSDPGPKTDSYLHLFILWMSLWGSVWVKRTTCRNQFFLSIIWTPGIQFMSSDRCLIWFLLLFIEKQNPCTNIKEKNWGESKHLQKHPLPLAFGLEKEVLPSRPIFSSSSPLFALCPSSSWVLQGSLINSCQLNVNSASQTKCSFQLDNRPVK